MFHGVNVCASACVFVFVCVRVMCECGCGCVRGCVGVHVRRRGCVHACVRVSVLCACVCVCVCVNVCVYVYSRKIRTRDLLHVKFTKKNVNMESWWRSLCPCTRVYYD